VNRRWHRLVAVLAFGCLIALPGIPGTQAQAGARCFPETGYCIAGPIRDFWERNGGLMAFGFPITPQQSEQIERQTTQVQWFERSRLELHPENQWPYDVLLGRMGVDRLGQLRRDWKSFPRVEPAGDCRAFAETGHAICGELLAAWRAGGLNLDGDPGINENESLALFGLPLSDATPERGSDGRTYTVQWFERARFELHPENPPPFNVLLGLLGRELSPRAAAPPPPPQTRASTPTRLVIDAIGLDYRTVGVGMDSRGELVVPDHDVGWYTASAVPGQGDNVVFWAHVLRFASAPRVPAPFARLKELPVGARLTVYDDRGIAHAYAITQQIQATPDQVEYILPTGRERVTMVSCYGASVIVDGSVVDMSHRLITIAEPI
jgi:Sortase domain